MVALCLTGFVTALSFRRVISHSQFKSYWLFDLRFILPTWAAAAVNLGFYAYLLWLGVMFYRMAQGEERLLVAGWFVGIFFGPVQILVPMSRAAIEYLQAVGMATAFLAAVYILFKVSAGRNFSAR